MPWNYDVNPTLKIIEVYYTGVVTADDLSKSTTELIAVEKEKGLNRFLIDTTEMEITASLADIYNLPTKQYREEDADVQGRVAVILSTSPKEIEAAEFYEIVCRNSGWMVHTFSERQSAINWLTESG